MNLSKSGCAAYDYAKRCKRLIEKILYRGLPLMELPPDMPLLYFGMLLTLTLDWEAFKIFPENLKFSYKTSNLFPVRSSSQKQQKPTILLSNEGSVY